MSGETTGKRAFVWRMAFDIIFALIFPVFAWFALEVVEMKGVMSAAQADRFRVQEGQALERRMLAAHDQLKDSIHALEVKVNDPPPWFLDRVRAIEEDVKELRREIERDGR